MSKDDICFMSACDMLDAIKRQELTSEEVTEAEAKNCKVDSDCEFVYVGACAPCSTSDEGYQCLPSKEAMEVRKERQKMLNNPEGFDCSICSQPLEIQHVCKCENGKCEKIRVESEEVAVTTDKMEYGMGEKIKLIIKNDSENSIWYLSDAYSISLNLFGYQNGEWAFVPILPFKPFPSGYIPQKFELKSSESIILEYVPMEHVDEVFLNFSKYKISFSHRQNEETRRYMKAYSNEFIIVEKAALDLRCDEKVKGIGPCDAYRMGYEFNSETGKCVKKGVSGCSFEIPFQTFEECQEVCEKDENVCMNEDDECTVKDIDCCDGLKKALLIYEKENEECGVALPCGSICIPCGNGICDRRENKCNCPEDCE